MKNSLSEDTHFTVRLLLISYRLSMLNIVYGSAVQHEINKKRRQMKHSCYQLLDRRWFNNKFTQIV